MFPAKLARWFQEELRQQFCKQHDLNIAECLQAPSNSMP